jgi:hypothetical protein
MGNTTPNHGANRPGNPQGPTPDQDAQKKEVQGRAALTDLEREQGSRGSGSVPETDSDA